jgi:beta-galactosidase beta subunit
VIHLLIFQFTDYLIESDLKFLPREENQKIGVEARCIVSITRKEGHHLLCSYKIIKKGCIVIRYI